jgi:hypothetical protein
MDLKEVKCEDVDWILVTGDRVQWRVVLNIILNPRVPQKQHLFDAVSLDVLFYTRATCPTVPYFLI